MGMFNSIRADLVCPVKGGIGKDTEIQIKWQKHRARVLATYRLGDSLDGLEEGFDNHWIRTEYICEVCSKKTIGYGNEPSIDSGDEVWHQAFVKIQGSRIEEILDEKEFEKRRIKDFVDDLWVLKR